MDENLRVYLGFMINFNIIINDAIAKKDQIQETNPQG